MKVLIFGLNWIGDVIMSFPAISSIPSGITVDILTRPHLAELYSFNKRVNKVFKVPTNRGISELLPHIKKIRKQNYDKIIVLPNSLRTALIAFLSKGKSYGFRADGRSILLNIPINKPQNFKDIHEYKLHKLLVSQAINIETKTTVNSLQLQNSNVFIQMKEKFNLPQSQNFFCIAPGAAFGSAKRWPISEFASLASKLIDKYHLPVIITGGKDEVPIASQIQGLIQNNIINLAGKTNLTELIHLIGNSKLLIANDSGTMHLSTLTRTPVAIPAGPTDMIRTGPMHKESIIVKALQKCQFAPCRKKICPLKQHSCMENISANMMLVEINRLFETLA